MGSEIRIKLLNPTSLLDFHPLEFRSPLLVPVMSITEHLEMMKLTQACISKGILKIHPSMEELIISLKSAHNKRFSQIDISGLLCGILIVMGCKKRE
jgi:hypothetical protein